MIEEHIYHFLTGLSFLFLLPILLFLSPGYIGTLPLSQKKKKNRISCGVNQKYYSAFDIAVAILLLQGGKN